MPLVPGGNGRRRHAMPMNPRLPATELVLAIETPAGRFLATFSERGLARLRLPSRPQPKSKRGRALAEAGRQVPSCVAPWLSLTRRALLAALGGRQASRLPPLDLSAGTEFQRRVWGALQAIPKGQVRTYGELAARLGRRRACRAVGQAAGANPIPVLIPCHRLVAAGGGLGGFSAGLVWKRWLLKGEGVHQ